jgi:hypothetical protein
MERKLLYGINLFLLYRAVQPFPKATFAAPLDAPRRRTGFARRVLFPPRGAFWQFGQKKLLRPATTIRRMGVLQR